MDRVKTLTQKEGFAPLRKFLESSWFSVLVGAIILTLYVCNLPILAVGICALLLTFIFLVCEDTRPALSVVLSVFFSLRYKYDSAAYLTTGAIVTYVACGIPLILTMIYRLVKRRVAWKRKAGLWSMALLSVVTLLGGVFTEYYNLGNFLRAIGRFAVLLGVYAFFAFTMEKREDNLVYFARICAVIVCLIPLQVLDFYVRNYEYGMSLDVRWKDKICLGWAISTITGETIAFLLPAVFYLIYKEKKGFWYWLVIAVGLAGIYFTFCRNALLWGGITTVVATVVNCFIGKNKKFNRIMVGSMLGLLVLGLVVLYFTGHLQKIVGMFLNLKLSNRGRFKIWNQYLVFFTDAPLQGVGFSAYRIVSEQTRVSYAHNTLLQMLGSTGLIGFAGYLVHRAQTVYLLAKKPTADRLFIGGCIVVALCISMLSSYFFYLYFLLFYAVILLLLEKEQEDEE